MEFERRNYPELPQPSGAFHHSVPSGNPLTFPGRTAGGTPAPTGYHPAHAEAILDKFEHILKENGGSLAHVVKVTSFVTDLREASAAGEVRMRRFAGAFPASTQVQVAALGTPDLKIEIDAIAVLPD